MNIFTGSIPIITKSAFAPPELAVSLTPCPGAIAKAVSISMLKVNRKNVLKGYLFYINYDAPNCDDKDDGHNYCGYNTNVFVFEII